MTRPLPDYWTDYLGELPPAILAYLHGENLTATQIRLIRTYLRDWIGSPAWPEDTTLEALREEVRSIQTAADIAAWLTKASDQGGYDPI